MEWKKTNIPIDHLNIFIGRLNAQIKDGADCIERMRCVYKIKDIDTIQCLMPYDFLDDLENKPDIVKFQLYQLID